MRTYLDEISAFSLIAVLLLTSTGCLKRVPVPPTSEEVEKSHRGIIYVYLKPGVKYEDREVLIVEDPKIEGEYLIGMTDNNEITLPLEDIDSIRPFHYFPSNQSRKNCTKSRTPTPVPPLGT
jgi:hypothetical protein